MKLNSSYNYALVVESPSFFYADKGCETEAIYFLAAGGLDKSAMLTPPFLIWLFKSR